MPCVFTDAQPRYSPPIGSDEQLLRKPAPLRSPLLPRRPRAAHCLHPVTFRLGFGVLWTLLWAALSCLSPPGGNFDVSDPGTGHEGHHPERGGRRRRLLRLPANAGRLPARAAHVPRSLPMVISACTEPNTLALTFDDGPSYPHTLEIMEAVEAAGGRATFFVVGFGHSCIYSDEAVHLLQRMVAHGHQVGSHTWTHTNLGEIAGFALAQHEMDVMDAAMAAALGAWPRFFRPPWGGMNSPIFNITTEFGQRYALTLWSHVSEDWDSNVTHSLALYADAFEARPADGSLLFLNHDTMELTAREIIPAVLLAAKTAGLRLVTVGECIGVPDPQDWYRFSDPHAPAFNPHTRNWTFPPRRSQEGDVQPRLPVDIYDKASQCVV